MISNLVGTGRDVAKEGRFFKVTPPSDIQYMLAQIH